MEDLKRDLVASCGCRTLAVFKGAGFSSMRNPLQRRYGQGDLHFITFSCFRRRPLLGASQARDCFVEILAEVRTKYSFRLVGYVIMPEHVHLLITEPQAGNPSNILQVLKQRVSRTIQAKRWDGNHSGEQHLWQRRFYDFNVWTGGKLTEKLEYIHMNPVKRKLVLHPKEWPWSSWSYYATGEQGLITIDPWNESSSAGENPHP
jgi:putative transposase